MGRVLVMVRFLIDDHRAVNSGCELTPKGDQPSGRSRLAREPIQNG